MITEKQIATNVLEYKQNASTLLESEISQLRVALNDSTLSQFQMTFRIRSAAHRIGKIETQLAFVRNKILHDLL